MVGLPVLLVGAWLIGFNPGPGAVPAGGFPAWFAAAAEGTLVIPEAVEERAERYRYVFVAGFYNERMPGYFAQSIKELRARGVPRRAIFTIAPSSHRSLVENENEVRDRFFEIAREGPEKLVVIAHSRGACDALAFALKNRDFTRDRIEALFLVQGPFGGSGIADYVAGEGPPPDRRLPFRYRLLIHLVGRVENAILDRGKHGGLFEMTRSASVGFWEQRLCEHADAIPIVGPKTFYVTTAIEPAQLRFCKRALAWYLAASFGPNDGLVAQADQYLPGLGTVLAVLDAGHTDLTNRFPSGRARKHLRRALIQSILMELSQPEFEPPDPIPAPVVVPRRRPLLRRR